SSDLWFGCERYCCLQTSVTVDLGRIALWLLGSLQIGSLTAPTSVSTGQPSLMAAASHRGQRPAPARQLARDRNVGHQGVLLPLGEALPPGVEAPVAGVTAGAQRGVHLGPPRPQARARGAVGLAVMPGRLQTSSRRTWVLPALVIDPCTREV